MEEQIRDLIAVWGRASQAGDLTALLEMMTDDVVFLTAGGTPMSRAGFASGFRSVIETHSITTTSDIQEISAMGNLAICWNRLEVQITPHSGGSARVSRGDVLTVFRRGQDSAWRIWRDANLLAAF